MFAWIKTPKGLHELEVDERLDCTSSDQTLFSCEGRGDLTICEDRSPAKIEHIGRSGSCSNGGTLATCDGRLHICE